MYIVSPALSYKHHIISLFAAYTHDAQGMNDTNTNNHIMSKLPCRKLYCVVHTYILTICIKLTFLLPFDPLSPHLVQLWGNPVFDDAFLWYWRSCIYTHTHLNVYTVAHHFSETSDKDSPKKGKPSI